MEDKIIDQSQLAEDVSSKIKYEFRNQFLVKPLEPVKVKKEFSEPVTDNKPTKDKNGIEAVDYDKVKTEVKEVDADFRRGVVLKVPHEYANPYSKDVKQFPINVGDIVIFKGTHQWFDLLKDSVLLNMYDIVATETTSK